MSQALDKIVEDLITEWDKSGFPDLNSDQKVLDSCEETLEKARHSSVRDQERLLQGLGALFSVRRASELMQGDDKANRAWLREQGLVHSLNKTEFVVWAEVIQKLRKGAPTAPTPARSRRSKGQSLPRTDLSRRNSR